MALFDFSKEVLYNKENICLTFLYFIQASGHILKVYCMKIHIKKMVLFKIPNELVNSFIYFLIDACIIVVQTMFY